MFNAARALLIMRGVDPDRAKRHATVWRLFSLHFVKDGPFDAADGRALGEAGRARNQADYSVKEVDAEAATDVMASLERFMVAAGSLLEDASATRRSGP
jgi:uncharacterized protein (UPF0332 family)